MERRGDGILPSLLHLWHFCSGQVELVKDRKLKAKAGWLITSRGSFHNVPMQAAWHHMREARDVQRCPLLPWATGPGPQAGRVPSCQESPCVPYTFLEQMYIAWCAW